MNKLKGKIRGIKTKDHLSEVLLAIDSYLIRAIVVNDMTINPNLVIGEQVFILFKETEVILSLEAVNHSSIANQIPVIVKEIEKGVLLSKVIVMLESTIIETVVPADFANKIGIGTPLTLLIRSNEIMIGE